MRGTTFLVCGLSALAVVVACGSSGSGDVAPTDDGGTTSSTSSGDPPGSSSSGVLPDAGQDAGYTLPEGCAQATVKATVQPLDVLVLFDTSDSMNDQVAVHVSKYKAVSDAINAFLTDKRSAGIGAGLTFFPVPKAGTPATCSAGTCPVGSGPCSANACDQFGPLFFCDDKTVCSNGAKCSPRGRCQYGSNTYCPTIGVACPADVNGFDRGMCVAQTAWCTKADSCADADYATPVLPISPLPAAAATFASTLAGHALPQGETPTYAALKGALDSLQAWHGTHPDHALALVFATDGGPNECNTSTPQIAQLAADALASPAKIRTFVIGLSGSASEEAVAGPVRDAIATAGGTGKPFVVTPNASTTTKFLDALTSVRGAALPCDYDIPQPDGGTADFGKLNVQFTPDGATKPVIYANRKTASGCDQDGGWYYDVDPATATPTKAILCPATCAGVNAQSGRVDVVIGCQTVVR